MQYKSIFKFIILGLILLSFISFILDFGAKKSRYTHKGKINLICDHNIDPDLIIFGSSVGENGINPNILSNKLSLTAYNSCLVGTRYKQYKGLVDEFNSYSKKNKYILFVETYFSFEDTSSITNLVNYLPRIYIDNIYNSLYSMQPNLLWKCRYIPFYKFIAMNDLYYKNTFMGWKSFFTNTIQKDTLFGFSPEDRFWAQNNLTDQAINNLKPFEIKINKKIVESYIKTIGELQSNGKQVIIILPPMYNKILKTKTDLSPLRNELKKISVATGAFFLDYSNSFISDDRSNFFNTIHLNLKGANNFTSILSDSLKTIINNN